MNKSKALGTSWETALVDYFRPIFGGCERLPLNGTKDQGDLWFDWVGQPYVVEAKAEQKFNLSQYMTEKNIEGGHWSDAHPTWPAPHTVAIVKRRQHGVAKAYVVMEVLDFVRLVKG